MNNPSARKSTKGNAKIGNKAKHESYREAFARIKAANHSKFFIESVAIQEAIISDRLKSHLDYYGKLPKRMQLADLLKAWDELNNAQRIEVRVNLPEMVNEWRKLRNLSVHGLISAGSVDTFLETAEAAAKSGEILARAVCDWHKAEKRKSKPKAAQPSKPAAK